MYRVEGEVECMEGVTLDVPNGVTILLCKDNFFFLHGTHQSVFLRLYDEFYAEKV